MQLVIREWLSKEVVVSVGGIRDRVEYKCHQFWNQKFLFKNC